MNVNKKLKCWASMILICFSVNVIAQEHFSNQNKAFQNNKNVSASDIISFLTASKEHTTLLDLLKVSKFDQLFSNESSYTLLAPTNSAFEKLPKGTVDTLMLSKNSEKLNNLLRYHMLPGKVNSTSIIQEITKKRGRATFKTENNTAIIISNTSGILTIHDEKGNKTLIETSDKQQSNGIVHVIDSVLMPE